MNTAAYWAKAWEQARKNSALAIGYANEKGWADYWNAVAQSYSRRNKEIAGHCQELVGWLAGEGILNAETIVLDVGCGPGTYALPLAERVKEVVALDVAENMLQVLCAEAAEKGLAARVRTLLGRWEDVKDEKQFDLVFAANSPAVYNYETLVKMNRVSRKYCCLVSFARGCCLHLRNQLWKKVMGAEISGSAFDVIYPFNILYCEGYYPQVKFMRYTACYRERFEVLREHYLTFFKIFGQQGPGVEKAITEHLLSLSQNGYCEDRAEIHLGIMWWRVT